MRPHDASNLRERILAVLTVDPTTARMMNAGALEEELWTEDDWRDEYAAELQGELDAMESDGLLIAADVWGVKTYCALVAT